VTLPEHLSVHPTRYHDAHLMVDFEREAAYLDGAPIQLTCKAYSLLACLVRHAGELVARDRLLMLVWGYSSEIRTRTLDVHIRRLRKCLGNYATIYVETIFGIGYRFQPCNAPAEHNMPAAAVLGEGAEVKWQWKMAGAAAN
jgi:DNA-binding response OmpR family regulator